MSEAVFASYTTGTHLYLHNDPAWIHRVLRYKLKPNGSTWSAEQTFFDASIRNSYPTVSETSPAKFRDV